MTAAEPDQGPGGRWLISAEVAALFGVDPKTVTRWGTTGRLRSVPTPGGRHRFPQGEVRALLDRLTTGPRVAQVD